MSRPRNCAQDRTLKVLNHKITAQITKPLSVVATRGCKNVANLALRVEMMELI